MLLFKDSMKPEILAPVGNMEAFHAALAAGCDAIYFGMPNFGARAYAQNFTKEQAKEVIDTCHLYGVKAYVTMNTLLYEEEIEEAYQQARLLHQMGVDALIVQDLGLLHLLHHRLPNLVLHASTQLSTNTPTMIEQLKKLGVQRVVLARECSLDQIKACCQSGMEVEVFVHGAICICYSGQCTMSSYRFDRSGNRGKCAQPCRMPYTLYKDGKRVAFDQEYLLSPKDLALEKNISDLMDVGVTSLKIEGRMKSPEYVYTAVQAVKKGLEGQTVTSQEQEQLEVSFHRGFTKGHAYQQTGKQLMNMKASNHQGIVLGKVISTQGHYIKMKLEKDLSQHDGIRFETKDGGIGCHVNYLYDEYHRLVNCVKAGSICEIQGPKGVKANMIVRKTLDVSLQKEIDQKIHDEKRYVSVSMYCTCLGVGHPLVIELYDGLHRIQVVSDDMAQKAQKRATDQATLEKQMRKTKDSFIELKSFDCTLGQDIFFTISQMNALRREAIEALRQARLKTKDIIEKSYSCQPEIKKLDQDIFEIQNRSQQVDTTSYWVLEGKNKANLVQSKGEVVSFLHEGKIVDASMNVTNSYAVAAILEMGYEGVVLADECSILDAIKLSEAYHNRYGSYPPVYMTLYQKRRVMIMQHCPVNTICKDGTRKSCALCHQHHFELVSNDRTRYTCLGDTDCHMRLYEQEPVQYFDEIQRLKNAGITQYKLCFVDESKEEISHILDDFKKAKEIVKY